MCAQHKDDLLDANAHFAFGENWASYAKGIGDTQIAEAESGLRRLLGDEPLTGKRFLDIGCGSGLHGLAALRLGAAEVLAVDIDPESVATTRAVLDRHASGAQYAVQKVSVFDLDPARAGLFDVVYSWGVLHHTGDMTNALQKAAALVAPGGVFAFALYRKTWMCGFWKLEKRWYAHSGPRVQKWLRTFYLLAFRCGQNVQGKSFSKYVQTYGERGMDFCHDVHDWLGGYPYESITGAEVSAAMSRVGLVLVRSLMRRKKMWRIFGKPLGIFGSGCDEYVYARPAGTSTKGGACAE